MKKLFLISTIGLFTLFYSCGKSSAPAPTPALGSTVSTYAGNGTAGAINGSGTGAELNLPVDIAEDGSGRLYISEQGNNDVRVIAPGAAVLTLAGSGTSGFKNGAATVAEFNGPEGIVVDDVGNVYVADAGNNVIRKIAPDGTVSTYAGNGTAGYLDGTATTAEFNSPVGLAIDKSRNIYVSDYSNNVIREISSAGMVTTLAGNGTAGLVNGTGTAAQFLKPSGLTIDASNNLYVAEALNSDIREISPSGQVSTFATGLPEPVRVAAATGLSNLYVSCGNNTIQQVTNAGKVTTYAGSGTMGYQDGTPLMAAFNNPLGLIANSQGVVIVCDNLNNRIRVVTP